MHRVRRDEWWRGDQPFGTVAYGDGNAGSYAFVGGANVKKIYTPPQIK